MKYMLMMHAPRGTGDWAVADWKPEELKAHIGFMHDLNRELVDRGELVAGEGLAAPGEARVVRAGTDGAPAVTDGPFPETKEFLAGFWIVEVDRPERAFEIAAKVSAARSRSTSRRRFSSRLQTTRSGSRAAIAARSGFLVPRTRGTSRPAGWVHQSVAPTSRSGTVTASASVSDGTSETTRRGGRGNSIGVPRSSVNTVIRLLDPAAGPRREPRSAPSGGSPRACEG